MGLWSKTVYKSKTGGFIDFIENQPWEVKYTIVDKENKIFDIVGNIQIRQTDLVNGELKFKINKLEGDLILYCREFKASIIPGEVTGKILFRNHRLGNYTKTTRYKIGEGVYFVKDNKITFAQIDKIILVSLINDKGEIQENLTYYAGRPEYPLKESQIFASREEVKQYLEGNKLNSISEKAGEEQTCEFAEGDQVWVMENNIPTLAEISRVSVIWEGNIYSNKNEEEKKEIKIEYGVKTPKGGNVTIAENKIFINKKDLINRI